MPADESADAAAPNAEHVATESETPATESETQMADEENEVSTCFSLDSMEPFEHMGRHWAQCK